MVIAQTATVRPINNLARLAACYSSRFNCCILCLLSILVLSACTTGLRDSLTQREILLPWTEITSVPTALPPLNVTLQPHPPALNYVTLRRPTSISAMGSDIYLLDAGLHQVFRYDSIQKTISHFASNLPIEPGMSIYAAPDMSIYIVDPPHQQVLHFNRDGTPLHPLRSKENLSRPVAVAADLSNGHVLVADGLFNRIIRFEQTGAILSIFKPMQVLAIAGMTTGPDGIYVVDRLAKRVVVMGLDGTTRYTFGANELREPGAIAVSRDNLVFISDNFDHTINIYRKQPPSNHHVTLADKIGEMGAIPGKFNHIGGMTTTDNLLYVADSLNARIQVMLMNPQAKGTGK